MDFKFTMFVVLALCAVAVLSANPTPTEPSPSPTKPSTTEKPVLQQCTEAQKKTIEDEWSQTKKCFGELIKEDNSSCSDVFQNKDKLINALDCASNNKNKTKTNVNAVLKMMNVTVKEYKDIVKDGKFAKCVTDNQPALKDCVSDNVPGKKEVADKLGEFDVEKEILGVQFNKTNVGPLKDMNACVKNVFNGKDECKNVTKYSDTLFKIAEVTAASASTIAVSNVIIMIGAAILALYF